MSDLVDKIIHSSKYNMPLTAAFTRTSFVHSLKMVIVVRVSAPFVATLCHWAYHSGIVAVHIAIYHTVSSSTELYTHSTGFDARSLVLLSTIRISDAATKLPKQNRRPPPYLPRHRLSPYKMAFSCNTIGVPDTCPDCGDDKQKHLCSYSTCTMLEAWLWCLCAFVRFPFSVHFSTRQACYNIIKQSPLAKFKHFRIWPHHYDMNISECNYNNKIIIIAVAKVCIQSIELV